MAFHDIRFPVDISFNSSGGPVRYTDIIQLTSGHEQRNTSRAHSRRRYNAGFGIKSMDQIEEIIAFFEARQGRLHSFRWRDPFDHRSCVMSRKPDAKDQFITFGRGKENAVQLVKTYVSGDQLYKRPIRKPVEGSVLVSVNGLVLPQSEYSVEYMTGMLSLPEDLKPTDEIRAGYFFDVTTRFDTDHLDINLAAIKAGDIPNISIIEVLEK